MSEVDELFYEDEEEIMELNNTITCLKIDMENLNDKYIREKIAKEEVEELLENSVPKEVIRNISNHIEYYLLGNLRYKDSQRVFEILLKKLKEILGD